MSVVDIEKRIDELNRFELPKTICEELKIKDDTKLYMGASNIDVLSISLIKDSTHSFSIIVDESGFITIPKEIRKKFDLKFKDGFVCSLVEETKQIVLTPFYQEEKSFNNADGIN